MHDEIVFFIVSVMIGLRQPSGQIHVLLLAAEAVCDPHESEIRHRSGMKASLFLQFAARQFLGFAAFYSSPALRQSRRPLLDGVAILPPQPYSTRFDRKN